jgi:peptidoglycan lytic transglycosylase
MRPMRRLRKSRPVQVAAGALLLAIPASAAALTAGPANAQSAVQINLNKRHIALGDDVVVTGTASGGAQGQKLLLQFARTGTSSWQMVRWTTLHGTGKFRFHVPLRESGLLRVVPSDGANAARTLPPTGIGSAQTLAPSAPQRVLVGSTLRVPRNTINVLAGQRIDVPGRLLPGRSGRRVELRGRVGKGWRTLATARTGGRGGFNLHYTPGNTGQQWLRVRFSGDGRNTGSWSYAGQVIGYREAVASWYDDGGATACGFHAYYGVANVSLPCGTNVTFRYGGHTVTATVDDRGPYVGGRTWDLNQNTASALGFDGVATVWATS